MASLPFLSDTPGVGRIDRTRQSWAVSEFAQRREAKKELEGRGKERRGEGAELSSRTARVAFRKYIRAGQTHRVVEQRLACARRKTHRKNRITTSALARNIKNIRRGNARSVERKNKAENALAPKGFIDAPPFRNEI